MRAFLIVLTGVVIVFVLINVALRLTQLILPEESVRAERHV
jgi:hypothetical protein